MITVVHVVKDLIGVRIMKIIEKLSKIFKPHCPKCKQDVQLGMNYCPNCGQKLLWENEENESKV